MTQPDWFDRYLDYVSDLLAKSGGVFEEGPHIRLAEDKATGSLKARLLFANGHRLHIYLAVVASGEFPYWRRYRIHFMDPSGNCAFRYDNSPHYPGLPFFPEHKHTGEQVEGHPQPSIRDILREIEETQH